VRKIGRAKFQDLKSNWNRTTLGRAVRVLSRRDLRKILYITIFQIGLSLVDLVGIALIGILGALAVTGVQSSEPGTRISLALRILQLDGFSFQTQVAVLGLVAASLLIGRTMFSVLFTRKVLYFLSLKGAAISAHLVSRLLGQSLLKVQERTTQETVFALTTGVNSIVLGVLATTVGLLADTALLVVISIGLFIIDPVIALITLLLFSLLGFVLFQFMNVRARKLGIENTELAIASNKKIDEVLNSYRESVVRNRRDYYSREIGKRRVAFARTQAEISFMPNISKYVIETAVVIGALAISATQFIFQDAGHAVGTLAVFMAAGTRISPAVLRIQQGAVAVKGSIGAASPTLSMIEEFGNLEEVASTDDSLDLIHAGFHGEIKINLVSFTYPGKDRPALDSIDINFDEGKIIALVGPSGAGKTTLVDVLLGVLSPNEGGVTVSGFKPLETISKWPGAISYVPQDVNIIDGTIRDNVSLGFPRDVASDELVLAALEIAALSKFVETLPEGLETPVGQGGSRISGGQRQRLGIARALFTKPKLLVLDEATSALDGETEAAITDAILKLKGKTTVVLIAHRLSTVRNADIVVYMADGKIGSVGSFEQVRTDVPDFDRQAILMGL
jgi:ABC-type multidrug transport system fused ATPase/permease subunit